MFLQKWLRKADSMKIPSLRMTEERRVQVNQASKVWPQTLTVRRMKTPLHLETPDADQLTQVEQMIRLDAEEGNGGFAIDEFTDDGFFNRQLLRNSQDIVVTQEPHGEPIAAAVIGQSAICRTVSPVAGGYIIVKKEFRNKQVGFALLDFIMEELERQGYTSFLTDVFPHCGTFLHIIMKKGFSVTGSMPKVGFVKGQGLTHSLLVYKDFRSSGNQMLPKL